MTTRLSDLSKLIETLCVKPYLFGVRSSLDVFFYVVGYSLCEYGSGIAANPGMLRGFYCYVAKERLHSDLQGVNWGALIYATTENDSESVAVFYELFRRYSSVSKLDDVDKYSNVKGFRRIVLKSVEEGLIRDAISLNLFIEGYGAAIMNNFIVDEEYQAYKQKESRVKDSILKDLHLPASCNCLVEIAARYYSVPLKGVEYYLSHLWNS